MLTDFLCLTIDSKTPAPGNQLKAKLHLEELAATPGDTNGTLA